MRLSIITVNLNNLDGLRATVQSVVSQSFEDFEFIIIDGGSYDGSVEWIKESSLVYPKIIWISEKDTGVFNAMNKGIKMSTGDYLLFLNSGDYLVDNEVLNHVFSVETNSDILLGRLRISKNGHQVSFLDPLSRYSLKYFISNSIAHQAAFIRRELFYRLGLYQEDFKFIGDWAFFVDAIVFNDSSVHPLSIIVSDYNLNGMSSDSCNARLIQEEKQSFYKQYRLNNIVTDYINWEQWLDDHRVMIWAWSKKCIRVPLESLYRLIRKIYCVKSGV